MKNVDECYIPLLEDVLLDAKATGVKVKIELKGPNTPEPVLDIMVKRLNMVEQCHYRTSKNIASILNTIISNVGMSLHSISILV